VSSRLRFSYCPAPARNALRKITFLRRHASMSRRKNIFLSALGVRLRFSMWTLRFVQFSKNIFSSLRPFYTNTFINKMSILFSLSLSDVKQFTIANFYCQYFFMYFLLICLSGSRIKHGLKIFFITSGVTSIRW
jgi:hypothetical protein